MNNDDEKIFAATITGVLLSRGRTAEPMLIEVYWGVLKRLSLAHFRAACAAYLATADEFPNPGKILALSPGRVNHIQSWGHIRSCIRSYGWCNSDKAFNALSQAQWRAIGSLGGWSYLCSLDSDVIERIGRTSYKDALDGAERQEEQLAERAQQIADAKADTKRLT